MRKAKSDSELLVITPAMPGSAGLNQEQRKELGLQYVDVGIAEEQAVAMASGAAKNGAKPLVVTNTTFIQRAYDQISHDVCINNSSVTILLNYNSFDSLTDVTHLGIFGLAAYTNVPNLVVLAPTSKDEYLFTSFFHFKMIQSVKILICFTIGYLISGDENHNRMFLLW